MTCKTLQGKYAEKLNDKINELYNKLDVQDEIIEQQIAIISEQKKRIDKAIEYNQKIYDTTENETKLMAKINLEILGDKENE